MNSVIFTTLTFVLAVQGGTYRLGRQNGWGASSGWNAPPPAPASTSIAEAGASEAVGLGAAIAEHSSVISLTGDGWTPAIASLGAGSNVGLDQYASNYQQSEITSEGSAAYQGNSASNSGYANEYLYGVMQGLNATMASSGWSAVEGEGAAAQIDELGHNAGPAGSGWKQS